ncbi:putative exoribonuclease family protein [Sarocladium strictum]
MATQQVLLSPAELAYLHTSLSLQPPIRPDGRSPTQFRPLTAETGILPGTNGSARVCFADGTEAIVGVKAEIEKSGGVTSLDGGEAGQEEQREKGSRGDWIELAVEIPGTRDDDAATVFLGEMLREALLADGEFAKKLYINSRFHWRLYLDVLLISPALSYPLPLLSLTTHLALLATRIPRLKSEGDEDPMFDDDWEASEFLYPRQQKSSTSSTTSRPPITLLVITVGDNIIFDPSKEELGVAETALAVSVAEAATSQEGRDLKLLSIRTVDPPSRLTPPGVPNTMNVATSGNAVAQAPVAQKLQQEEARETQGVWRAPLGGTKFAVVGEVIEAVLRKGGVAEEVLDGLDGVEVA